ncbi:MAG: cupredoxin domain-containing protein, partial [Actinomycetota bacterium]|nr:cupredoxin domain-containing protein [Actinomycetota bacterium]
APAPVETAPDGVVTYRVARFQFPAVTVSPGATLRIVDGDSEPHTVTALDGSFDSGSFDPDRPATLTAPTKPGTYKITCTIHPSMEGEIVVR